MIEQTQICGLNLGSEVINSLKNKEINVYDGSIGSFGESGSSPLLVVVRIFYGN